MKLNLRQFYQACNPSKTLVVGDPDQRRYYIDFSAVRGGKIIEELSRTIARLSPDDPTCQLFTGHIGCGKSTELLRLKQNLEEKGFYVVYFESSEDLEMADVDLTDILLAIAHKVSENLKTQSIYTKSVYFQNLFTELFHLLPNSLEFIKELDFDLLIGQITAQSKESPKLRSQLRQYLEPRTSGILNSINTEIIHPATTQLKQQGKKGLVVIVDNLDRVDNKPVASGRSQPEYLFVDRGEQLRKLNCHLVYTIPLSLIFSSSAEFLKNRLGGGVPPKVLPMVPVHLRSGEECQQGLTLLRKTVLARAFPDLDPAAQLSLITEIVDTPETLDRLCRVSGGHIRNLLGLIYRCLQSEDPPFSRNLIETVISERAAELSLAMQPGDWELLQEVAQTKQVRGESNYQRLLRNMSVFEYRVGDSGRWFDINPMLFYFISDG
jgi:nucleoside-triphosphatase THEP1